MIDKNECEESSHSSTKKTADKTANRIRPRIFSKPTAKPRLYSIPWKKHYSPLRLMYTVKMLHLLSIMQVFVFKLLLTFLHSAIPLSRQKLGERLTALWKLVFSAAFNLPPPSTSTPPVAPVARKT